MNALPLVLAMHAAGWGVILSMLGALLFVGFIVLGCLKWNDRWEQKVAAHFPAEALQELLSQGFSPGDLLVAVPQSRWTEALLLLKDSAGQPLGRVHYGFRNKIWIELGEKTYHVREVRAGYAGLAESELVLDGRTLASNRGSSMITEPCHFEVPEIGRLTLAANLKSAFKRDFPVVCKDRAVGRVLDTGRIGSGWRVLALQGGFPLPVRAYILALANRHMT